MVKRSRNWVLTINYKETTPTTNDELLELIKSIAGIAYTAFQLEQGDEGTFHHQVYISFANAKSFDTIKKHFPTAHIEAMQGTPEQASLYCSKEDTRVGDNVTWGELPIQGQRNDLEDIYGMLQEGSSFGEIREKYPSQYMRYRDKIHVIKQELLEEKFQFIFRKLEVIYMSDRTGVGKTRYILEKYGYENVYRISNYRNPFDLYLGQNVIVFEEFRSSLPIEQMLHFLDGYPLRLPARYSDRVACYQIVYVVSNWDFEQQYEHVQADYWKTFEAFKRRFTFIGNLEAVKKYNETKDLPY